MSDGRFKPGESGNPAGKPKGTKNRKTLLREELEKDGSALAAAIKAKALEGDMTAAGLWLARLEPVLRQRGPTIEFELDVSAPLAAQMTQVIEAVAAGELCIDDAKQITDMIRQLAEVRALEGGDDKAQKLVDVFKQFAQGIEARTVAPYTPPGSVESGTNTPPLAPPAK